jgi:hypothetical protein
MNWEVMVWLHENRVREKGNRVRTKDKTEVLQESKY